MTNEEIHQLAQRLRIDSIRAAAAANSGHPTSSMSAADLMAVLMARHLRYDYDKPGEPQQRSPDLLQGPRLAAGLRDVRRRRRDHRRGAVDLPPVRLKARGPPDSDPSRGSTSPPARWARACRSRPASRCVRVTWTACPTASSRCAATPRWPRARSGRPSSTPASQRPGQPRRDRRRQPPGPARRDHAWLGPQLLRQARRGRRLARDRDRRPRHRRDRPRLLRGRGHHGPPDDDRRPHDQGLRRHRDRQRRGQARPAAQGPRQGDRGARQRRPGPRGCGQAGEHRHPAQVRLRPVGPAAHLRGRRRRRPDA